MRRLIRLALPVALTVFATPAATQPPGVSIPMPGETATALYARLQPALGSNIVATTNVAYGPDARHRLDVFSSARTRAELVPIVLFVHGGGYVGGNKATPGTPFYQSVGAFWVRSGMVGVNVTYRLAPQHAWPSGAADLGEALKWVRENAEAYGGDPDRIVLMGHSAGASHVATYIFNETLQPAGGDDGVVGAILMSGWYDPATAARAGTTRAYFGDDESRYAARAARPRAAGRTIPVFIGVAEHDPPGYHVEAEGLFNALCARDLRCPRMKRLAGHDHMTSIFHLGTSDLSLSADLIDFVRSLDH